MTAAVNTAERALIRREPRFRPWIAQAPRYRPHTRAIKDPYRALARSIVYQQLSTKAAATIWGRFLALTPGPGVPTPGEVESLTAQALRGAGLSRPKIGYLRDLAATAQSGTLPGARRLTRLTDEEIVEALTTIKGIGRWSVEMYLIFNLARPDVLPVTDLGIRKGFARLFATEDLPQPEEIAKVGAAWSPYRTAASWYLWRCLETDPVDAPRGSRSRQ